MPAGRWHPCDDGITPIVKALQQFNGTPGQGLYERLKYTMTRPSQDLIRVLHESVQGLRAAGRLETLRRWLQFNRHEADAVEVVRRLDTLRKNICEWEQSEWERAVWEETKSCFGPDYELRAEAVELGQYLQQLGAMIRGELARQGRTADPPVAADTVAVPSSARSEAEIMKLSNCDLQVVQAVARLSKGAYVEATPSDDARLIGPDDPDGVPVEVLRDMIPFTKRAPELLLALELWETHPGAELFRDLVQLCGLGLLKEEVGPLQLWGYPCTYKCDDGNTWSLQQEDPAIGGITVCRQGQKHFARIYADPSEMKWYVLTSAGWQYALQPNADANRGDAGDARSGKTSRVPQTEEVTHAPDFTSVSWYGTMHRFSKGQQAQAVRVLWEAWEAGGHSVGQEKICEEIESSALRFQLRTVFRIRQPNGSYKQHPAWGTMIQQAAKGTYHLAPPNPS